MAMDVCRRAGVSSTMHAYALDTMETMFLKDVRVRTLTTGIDMYAFIVAPCDTPRMLRYVIHNSVIDMGNAVFRPSNNQQHFRRQMLKVKSAVGPVRSSQHRRVKRIRRSRRSRRIRPRIA